MDNTFDYGTSRRTEAEGIDLIPRDPTKPIRTLVTVRFIGDGRAFPYYNDEFDLVEGDFVFVSGKLAGKLGVVEKISTKFKINLADYQRIISKACSTIHGTYEAMLDKMISYDRYALSPEEFRSWIMPPRDWNEEDESEDEIIVGDGYELSILAPEESEDVSPAILQRALDYCRDGSVAYICMRNGAGTAYINGTSWYEVNFEIDGDTITEMYCDCPYPGLCKHLLAVALTIRALAENGKLRPEEDFVAIDSNRFWNMVARTTKKVTL